MLQVTVTTEGITFLMTALCIELNEVAGNVLNAFLGFLFQPIPRSRSKRTEAWRLACIRPTVLTYLVK